jgi:periplasmic protein TonB
MIAAPILAPRPGSTCRLTVGLALSLLTHMAAIMIVQPMAVDFIPARSLQVEIVGVSLAGESVTAIGDVAEFRAPASMKKPVEPVKPQAAANPSTMRTAGPDLGLAPDRYYTSREVDVRAEPINDVSLVYPQLAYQYRIKGMVVLKILISERGAVDDISVVEAEPWGVFEETALSATRALKFSPAIRNGRPVKSQKTVEVSFDPYESIHIP